MTRKLGGNHRANASAKGGRECVEDIHGWREPLGESFIVALRSIKIVGLALEHGEDRGRRITAVYLLRERVSNKVFLGLLLVLYQSSVKDWLKV